uniref:dynamin GTPase n=1 Tax=Salix viminalis TaxID=40686 RepID=A0A6N2MLA9_SALVM
MEAIEELSQLSESMKQATALLADEDVDESPSSNSRRSSTFLNVVALGCVGAGKSAVLNSVIGHPVLPTGENATRAPTSIDLQRDGSLSSKSIVLQIDNKSQQVSASALRHSLQDRLSKGATGQIRDEIYLKLRTSTAPSLKLIDLPGLDQRIVDESMCGAQNVTVGDYAEHSDAILLVVVPAAQAPEIASYRALRIAKEYDGEDALAQQIRKRMKVRLPNLLSGLQGKSQIVQDELVRLGEQMVQSAEGTRAIALELCREFEDKFLQHIMTGEGSGWKIVASFEGNFPNRIKQLPLDRHFDINNVKRIVLEADGYQPYLISPEKGLRSLIKGVLELAKEPSRLCVDEVHHVLVDIVSASANATPGLGRYPPFKREVVAIASAALDGFKNESKKMVVALVDMERVFVPPQHFIRLVQRRMERQRREEELKNRSSKKGNDAEQAILNRATSPQTGGSLKSMREKSNQADKEVQEASGLKTAGPEGELTAGFTGFLSKKSAKTNGWSKRWFVLNEKTGKLGYTKTQEERHFRGVITLEECNIEEVPDEEEPPSKSLKDKKVKGPDTKAPAPSLVFKITSKVPYKTVLKVTITLLTIFYLAAHSAVILKAESMADKVEWINKMLKIAQPSKGGKMRGVSPEGGPAMRHSLSDGSLDTMPRRPADPEEELRWMSQEVRGYVEAVLNSLAANVPKAVVLCQVEKAKEDMLNQLYSSISAQSTARIEELLQEDQNVKRRRERCQKQTSLLSKLTRQLSIHDNRAAAASSWSSGDGAESTPSPRTNGSSGDDWRSAFDAAANGAVDTGNSSRPASNGYSRYNSSSAQNGDVSSGSNSSSRRTPNRFPPAPRQSGSSGHRY